MKILNLFLISILLISFYSCERVDSNLENEIVYNAKATQEIIKIQNSFEYTSTLINKSKGKITSFNFDMRNSDCVSVTASNSFGHFPNTLTIDFGDGCIIDDSITISGKIITDFSGFMNHTGDSTETHYENFYINGINIKGIYINKNLGKDSNGRRSFIKKIIGAEIIDSNGDSASYNSTKISSYDNNGTPFKLKDDKLLISGSFKGQSSDNKSFEGIIRNQLVLPFNCGCIVEGDIDIVIDLDDNYNLNYGNGQCDKTAILTYPDNTTEEIEICK